MTDGRNNQTQQFAQGLYLLFSRNYCPDRAAIHEFVKAHPAIALTLDPFARPNLHLVGGEDSAGSNAADRTGVHRTDRVWVELLRDGLTFDLEGLAPGRAFEVPPSEHKFDCAQDMTPSRVQALRLVPGAHLAGGEATLPVLRGMLGLARDLVQHFEHVEAVAWPPSASVIGRRYFESSTTAWLEGGAFPALGLTAFREALDGGLQSIGLDFLIGQELRIEPMLAGDKVAATRLGVRLINRLVLTGPVKEAEQLIGPDGDRLQLEPSKNGKYIRVWGN